MNNDLSPEDQRIVQELIENRPGPAPYQLPALTGLLWQGQSLTWTIRPSPDDLPEGTPSVVHRFVNSPLLKAGDTVLGQIDSGVCVYPRAAQNTLFTVSSDTHVPNQLTIQRFPIDELQEFPEDMIREYQNSTVFHTTLAEPVTFTFSVNREAGTQEISFPAEFAGFGSFLIYTTGDTMQEFFLLDIDTTKGTVRTMPQDWFNAGTYETDYEWPMYAIRGSDGKIYGEGMRMGVFELSDDGLNVARWLKV